METILRLEDRYVPSPACTCDICRSFCLRPGWWTVEQASNAIHAGYSDKMMLEIAPDFTFAVLAPSFKGCEGLIALNDYSRNACTFFNNNLCKLHETGLEPLECKVSYHAPGGIGQKCHFDIEMEWKGSNGQALVVEWMKNTGFWHKLSKYELKPKKIKFPPGTQRSH